MGMYDIGATSGDDLAAMVAAANAKKNSGEPAKPQYNSQLGENGLLKDIYQVKPKNLDYGGLDSYNTFKQGALSTDLSPWGQMQKKMLDSQTAGAQDQAGAQSMQAQAQARSGLAMRGGLSSGARERIATSGARDLMGANQGINKTATQSLLGIGAQDAQQKQSMLGQLMGLDTGAVQANTGATNEAQKANISGALNQQANQNTYNMETYKEQMDKWAANKQADATAASASSGGK